MKIFARKLIDIHVHYSHIMYMYIYSHEVYSYFKLHVYMCTPPKRVISRVTDGKLKGWGGAAIFQTAICVRVPNCRLQRQFRFGTASCIRLQQSRVGTRFVHKSIVYFLSEILFGRSSFLETSESLIGNFVFNVAFAGAATNYRANCNS